VPVAVEDTPIYSEAARPCSDRDVDEGKKWGGQWVFPATWIYLQRETGQPRRHHVHESALQHVVRVAVIRAGTTKPVGYHMFHHCFATTS
jgi:hypothetical protein